MAQVLDETGGFVLYREDQRLVFVDRGTRWTVWTRFVLGLVTGIVGVNAVVQLALIPSGGGVLVAGVVMAFVAVCTGVAFSKIHRHAKRVAAKPVSEFCPLIVVDLGQRALLDHAGRVLAPLAHVSFRTAFQATSSARSLECRWPGGRMTVARGGGMGGVGVDGALAALQRCGVRVGS